MKKHLLLAGLCLATASMIHAEEGQVTINWPQLNGANISETVTVEYGTDITSTLNKYSDCFTISNLSDLNTTASADNNTFTLQGEWDYWMQVPMNTPMRLRLKPHNNANKYLKYGHIESNQQTINGKYTDNANVVDAERIWYFKNAGFENGMQKVTLHCMAVPDYLGVKIGTNSQSTPEMSWELTVFTLSENTATENTMQGFGLRVGTSGNAYINEHGGQKGWFSIYNAGDAKNDQGGILKCYPLTADEINSMTSREVPNYGTITYNTDLKATAAANPTIDNMRAMIDDYNQVLAGKLYRIQFNRLKKGETQHVGITLAGFADIDADGKNLPLNDSNDARVLHQAYINAADVNQIWKVEASSNGRQSQFSTPNGYGYYMGTPTGVNTGSDNTYVTKNAYYGEKFNLHYWRSKGWWIANINGTADNLNHNNQNNNHVIKWGQGNYYKDEGNRILLQSVMSVDYIIPEASAMATVCYPFAITIPEDVTVYIATGTTSSDETNITIEEYSGSVLPANTPALIKSTNRNLVFNIQEYTASADEQALLDRNILTGVLVQRKPYAANTHYVLNSDGTAFEKVTTDNAVAASNTAILEVSKLSDASHAVDAIQLPSFDYADEINALKEKAAARISLNVNTPEAIEAWNAAVSSVGNNSDLQAFNTVETAFNAFIHQYREVSLTLEYKGYLTDYLGVYNGNPRRVGHESNGNRAWTIKPTENGGFKFYNNYRNAYLTHTATAAPSFTENQANAAVYYLEVYDAASKTIGLYIPDLAEDKAFISDDDHSIAAAASSENSQWIAALIDEASTQPAREYFNGRYAAIPSGYTYGEEVGQYTKSEEYAAIEDQISSLNTNADATAEELRAGAVAILGITRFATINSPKAGHFYRFKGSTNEKYMSSTVIDDKMQMTTVNNGPETVFYYDGSHLAAFSDGLVLGKFLGNDQSNSWKTLLSTHEKASTPRFSGSETIGCYIIDAASNRNLHNLGDVVNCGGDTDQGYRWTIEPVNQLPIPGSSTNGWTTFLSPIEVNTCAGVTAYSLTENGNNIVINEIASGDNGVIPANTPVALHFQNAEVGINGLVNLNINYSDAQPVGESHLAKAKTDGVNYITLSGEQFVALTDANIPGFKATLETPEAKTYAMVDETVNNILTAVEGKVYTINCDGRGILTVNNDDETLEVHGNATGNNTLWTIVNHDGNTYLFNLGTQKFAAAYAAQPEGARPTAKKAEFRWHVDNYPTAVTIDWDEYDATVFATNAKFTILGGQNTLNSERPAGMMGIDNKVPCISGVNAKDGNGFIFTEVAGATIPEALAEKIAEAKAEMAEAHDKFAEVITNENTANTVGYFDQTTMGTYHSNFTPAEADADAETKYYAYMRAKNSVAEPAYNKFEHSGKYNLMNENGQYYHAAATKNADGSYTLFAEPADIDGNDPTFNWLATVSDDGLVTLAHTFQAPANSVIKPRNAMHRAASDFKDFPVNFVENEKPEYDGYGNITLPFEGKNVILRATTLDDNAQTTAIREIEAAGEGNAEVIYDLQGRRLNRALRGINIINGKKVYIK